MPYEAREASRAYESITTQQRGARDRSPRAELRSSPERSACDSRRADLPLAIA